MISVIVATYNRAPLLHRGLRTIMGQTLKADEIVVVDDGSSDNTKQTVDNWRGHGTEINYIYLDHPEPRISCIPRNVGIKQAKGDILIFTEPEALHMETNFERLINKMAEYPENTILASQVWTMGQRIFDKLNEEYFIYPERMLNHEYAMMTNTKNPSNTKAPDSDWGITGEKYCNAGILFSTRKNWLMDIGGFDEELEGHAWDDFNLYDRLGGVGHGVVKDSTIATIHQWHDKSFYPYNIYEAAERNGKLSESKIHRKEYRANIGKEWGMI